jgi:uncharacterized protein YecT (DUF1311 family)
LRQFVFPAASLAAALALLVATTNTRAAAVPKDDPAANLDRTLDQCLNDPQHSSTGDQDRCIDAATNEWDALLNRNYSALNATLPEQDAKALQKAQHAWVRSRDADLKLIDAVYATVHGTMYAPMSSSEVMELTRRRATLLGAYWSDRKSKTPSLARHPHPVELSDFGKRVHASHSGSDYEREHCKGLTGTDAIARCAAEAVPLYTADLERMTQEMQRRLPPTSRRAVRASERAWQEFLAAEATLLGDLYPASTAVQALYTRESIVQRLERIVGEVGVIGAK